MNKNGWMTLATLTLIVVGAVWAIFFRGDSRLKAAQQLQQQLAAPNLGDQQRRELWKQLREQSEQLSPEARRQLWQSGREGFQHQMQDRVKHLLSLPVAQRNAELDKDIARMAKRRAQWQQRGPGGGFGGGGPGGNGAGGQAGGQQQNRPNWGNMSDQDRNARRKSRLDDTTPEFRAAMSEYRRMMQQRRGR